MVTQNQRAFREQTSIAANAGGISRRLAPDFVTVLELFFSVIFPQLLQLLPKLKQARLYGTFGQLGAALNIRDGPAFPISLVKQKLLTAAKVVHQFGQIFYGRFSNLLIVKYFIVY